MSSIRGGIPRVRYYVMWRKKTSRSSSSNKQTLSRFQFVTCTNHFTPNSKIPINHKTKPSMKFFTQTSTILSESDSTLS